MNLVVALLTLLVVSALAGSSSESHYSMGPTHRFEPTTGDEASFISFANGIIVDTRTAEPNLPAGLASHEEPGQVGYYIIQFEGPIRRDWVAELEGRGIRPFGYLPNYAVLARLDREQSDLVRALPRVRWVGLFQPAYKLQSALMDARGFREVVVQLMPGAVQEGLMNLIEARGGAVIEALSTSFATTVRAGIAGDIIPEIAQLQEVLWIQEWIAPEIANNQCQWVTQTGWRASAQPDTAMSVRTSWLRGVRGKRLILSTTDTGLNLGHDMFRDPNMPVTAPGIWPDHRKVVAFKLYQGANLGETPYHGSHVNGTVAGDDSVVNGTSYYDGMAIKGRLYFVDLTSAGGGFVIGADLTPLWDSVHLGRGLPDSLRPILQHSGSWGAGNSTGDYTTMDASTDAYCWAHPDFLNIFAAGNEGGPRRIRNPGIAKNVLTVGATGNGTASNTIAGFSSRGPTQDNRIKPNICAPGVGLNSAQASPSVSGYSSMSGTSMATPAVNGAIGLMRCYLREGYYPTGTPVPADRINYISSALLRSMAMVSGDPNVAGYVIPSFDIGWGRIDADSALYFAGDQRKLTIKDDTSGIGTGEYREAQFVVNFAIPLKIALAWTDTAAAPTANPTLVNDLNLEVTDPSGTYYRGNQYSGGQSVPNPGSWDNRNVEECVRVNSPAAGTWTIRVRGQNVATAAKQRFAYTITGDVSLPSAFNDVGVLRIVAPADTVDTGNVVTPQAWVRNFGNRAATFPVTIRIGSGYSNTQTVPGLQPDDSFLVSFADWTAARRGAQAVRCSTDLTVDQNAGNDTLSGLVAVRVKDAGVFGINKPAGTYGPREIVTPAATIRNYGNVPASFEVWMLLTDPTGALYYSESTSITNLDPANNVTVSTFRPCTLRLLGDWTAKCSLALTDDTRFANNVRSQSFATRSQWVEMKSMPERPSSRTVKDGAWLACDAASGLIYAAKGNKSSDFYSYNILANDWTTLRAIPLGLEAKLPRRGACAASDGSRYVYMTKGNNTLGFWRYDIATDSWLQLANVPAGAHRKVKAGSAVYVQIGDSGYVYLLKGPTTEFYRFNVATWKWETMQPAPMGSHPRWYGGSFLVFDGDHTIYAHKARYHELWAYDVLTGVWSGTRLNGMPFVGKAGRTRKSRDGGSGAFFEGGIYALKGGSTDEFWRYDATANTWAEFDVLPAMAASGKVRKVYAGGSMVSVDGTLFALKGNKTNELWRFALGYANAPQPSREGVMAAQTTLGNWQLAISPNPLASGFAVLRYSLPKAGLATLNVFDVAGRSVLSQTIALGLTGAASLDLRRLNTGVYLVKLTTEGCSMTQKLGVEH